MKTLLVLFCFLFSSVLLAEENSFSCVFSFSEYDGKQQPIDKDAVDLMQLDEFKIFADFRSVSKKNWIIDKIYLEEDLEKTLEYVFDHTIESFSKSFSKILYQKELTVNDKKIRNLLLKEAGINLDDLNQFIKSLSKTQKEDLLIQFENEYNKELKIFYKEFGDALEDITKNQEDYFINYIKNFNSYGEIKIKGNKIVFQTVTDGGMLVENTINYGKLLEDLSDDSVSLKMTFVDGNSAFFKSRCLNKTYLNVKGNVITIQEIESKLSKIKSLYENGLLTLEQYNKDKNEIINQL